MLTDGGTPVSWSHCNMRVVPSTWHGSVRRSRGRPTRPSCELGARCGWPAEGKDPTTLRFSASVRQIVLEQWLGATTKAKPMVPATAMNLAALAISFMASMRVRALALPAFQPYLAPADWGGACTHKP